MFCSNSYDFTDQSHFAFTGNENLISSSSSSRFLHFPDSAAHADQQDQPFLADYDDNDLFMNHFFSSQHQINDHLGSSLNVNNMASDHRHHQQEAEIKIASLDVNNRASSNTKKENAGGVKAQAPGVPRKRGAGKKDRHSKIFTAQGPRDRRMRLSLQIARKFFDLQDMLGFDKASKTIEWLFSKSKAAIKELTESLPLSVMNSCTSTGGGALSLSSTNSESEVASAIINNKSEEIGDQKSSALPPPAAVKRTKSRVKSTAANNPIARESRDKARARARERTVERMKMNMRSEIEEKLRKCCDLDQLQEANPNEEEENRMDSDDVSIIEKFLGITTSAPRSSPSIFDYTQSLESIVNNNQLQAQNPGEIFRINNLDTQEQESRSIYMGSSTSNAAREQNPNPAGPASQNPSSIFISTSTNIESQPQFQEHHFSCSPIVDQMDKSFSSIWKFR